MSEPCFISTFSVIFQLSEVTLFLMSSTLGTAVFSLVLSLSTQASCCLRICCQVCLIILNELLNCLSSIYDKRQGRPKRHRLKQTKVGICASPQQDCPHCTTSGNRCPFICDETFLPSIASLIFSHKLIRCDQIFVSLPFQFQWIHRIF